MPEKLRLEESMAQVARAVMSRARFSMPGIIRAYDPSTQTCEVQPAVAQADGTEYPVIPKLPVAFFQAGFYSITAPLRKGDPCWILFAEMDIDAWLHYGQIQPPRTGRRWAWNDAMVIPAVTPYSDSTGLGQADADDMVIGDTETGMRIRINAPYGTVTIGDESKGIELLDLIEQVLAALQITTVNTGIGPQPLSISTINALSQIRLSLQDIKG